MQRIIVDLPEPDGPQTHDASRRVPTIEVDVLQHMELAVPFVDGLHLDHRCRACRLVGIASAALLIDPSRAYRRWLWLKVALEHLAVARHEEAEAEIDRRGEDVGLERESPASSGRSARRWRCSSRSNRPMIMHQRGVLEGADESC